MTNYSDKHRAFLQVFINRGALGLSEAITILRDAINLYGARSSADTINRDTVINYVREINVKLAKLQQKLVVIEVEYDAEDKEYIVFTNTTHSSALHNLSQYNEVENNFFKAILDSFVTSESFCLPMIHFLNMSASVQSTSLPTKKLTKKRAEELLDYWCSCCYFVKTDEDLMHFGPRTIGEFSDYLRTKYTNYICICLLCNKVTFQGIQCANAECGVFFHKTCLQTFLIKKKKCPQCKEIWKEDNS